MRRFAMAEKFLSWQCVLREPIRDVTKKEGIVLVFDEVSAGFRLCNGGSHLVLVVEPDIATLQRA